MVAKYSDSCANIKLFGNDLGDEEKRERNGGSVIWGAIVLFVGLILLLNNLGLVSWKFWDYVWQFWPALFILGGIHIIVGNGAFGRIVMFIVTLLVIGYVAIYGLTQVNSPVLKYIPIELGEI